MSEKEQALQLHLQRFGEVGRVFAAPARVNLMRRAHGDATYLAGKKVVIWCFTEREFTEGNGWAKVPLTPAAATP